MSWTDAARLRGGLPAEGVDDAGVTRVPVEVLGKIGGLVTDRFSFSFSFSFFLADRW